MSYRDRRRRVAPPQAEVLSTDNWLVVWLRIEPQLAELTGKHDWRPVTCRKCHRGIVGDGDLIVARDAEMMQGRVRERIDGNAVFRVVNGLRPVTRPTEIECPNCGTLQKLYPSSR